MRVLVRAVLPYHLRSLRSVLRGDCLFGPLFGSLNVDCARSGLLLLDSCVLKL